MAILQWLQQSLPSSFLIASSLLMLMVLKFLFKKNNTSKKRKPNLPPSPPKLPIIGNLHQLGKMPHISLGQLAAKYGPIIHLQLGEIPTVVISSAKMAKEVMKPHDLALSNRPEIFSAKQMFYNCTDIAFSPYGPYWRQVRKFCILELFSAKRVQSYASVREEEVRRLVDRVAGSGPGTVDLTKMLGLYANSVLCRVVLGTDFSGGGGEYERYGFQKMLEEYQELLGGFSIGDFFPSVEFVHTITGLKSRLRRTFEKFDRLFDEVVSEHLESKEERNKDLVDVMLNIQKNEATEIPLTLDNIKAIILDMFAAGTDTTFITLDWGMTELVMNPKVLERAQKEIRSIVGERKFISENDIPRCPYLKAVIKEIFRLHPPAPVLVPRESMEDIVVAGYEIPAKTRFFINAWAMGRDPKTWDDPGTFKPERFMDSSIDFKGQDFELIPFGVGRRICPGITFGTVTVELALAQLLHSFDWELPHGIAAKDLDLTEVFGISMHRKSHLIVVAKSRF